MVLAIWLVGKIPDCLGEFRFLKIFNVANNYIEGAGGFDEDTTAYCIPGTIGSRIVLLVPTFLLQLSFITTR